MKSMFCVNAVYSTYLIRTGLVDPLKCTYEKITGGSWKIKINTEWRNKNISFPRRETYLRTPIITFRIYTGSLCSRPL